MIGTAQLMVTLDTTIVNIALPSAQRDLAFSTPDRQWVVTAYALAFGCLLLVGGRITDVVGRKRAFILGLAGFAVASFVGGAATSLGTLVAARATQGAFGALVMPAALALLIETFTDLRERAQAFAVYSIMATVGGAVGLMLGGVLAEYLSWRWCLYVNVGFALFAIAGAVPLIASRAERQNVAFDVPGSVTSFGGLAAIVYGCGEASLHGWGHPLTYGPIIGGILLLGVFVMIERSVSAPLVPLRVLANRTRAAAYIGRTIGGLNAAGFFLVMTYYFQSLLGFSPTRAGVAFLPFLILFITGAQLAQRRLISALGPKTVIPTAMVIGAAGLVWLSRMGLHSSYISVVPGMMILGLGAGTFVASSVSLGLGGVDPADVGVASALVTACYQLGASIGAPLLNTVASNATAEYLAAHHRDGHVARTASLHGAVLALLTMAAIFLAAALVTLLLHRRRERSPQAPPPSPDVGTGDAVAA
ncbi:MFS transporter [Streptomyces sp. NPDC051963]|uniref:MFS transporter n=1 Tax=Streptomyces sp. NPDC051963 TaxID=3365678 RepID=UPI0037D62F62